MRSRITLVIGAACAAVAFAVGCGGDADDGADATTGTTATAHAAKQKPTKSKTKPEPKQPKTGTTVEVAGSDYGDILVDSDGRTLYLFDKESTERSECFGACEDAWPVLFTDGAPRAGKGVDGNLLGTTEHDGRTQVTYDGHPLYYYAHEGPNEVLCHGVDEFGGLWLVVDPSTGDAVPA